MRRALKVNHLGAMMRLSRTVAQQDLRTVANEIGIGHATLMRIEHGEAFDVTTMMKLLTWLLSPVSGERK